MRLLMFLLGAASVAVAVATTVLLTLRLGNSRLCGDAVPRTHWRLDDDASVLFQTSSASGQAPVAPLINGIDDSRPAIAAPAAVFEGTLSLATKAKIVSTALARATTSSVAELLRGNLTGAWHVAAEAASEASSESALVDATMSTRGSRALGIFLVFLLVGLAWGLEHLLKHLDERSANETTAVAGTAASQDSTSTLAPTPRHHIDALSFARLVMACFVVFYNFYSYRAAPKGESFDVNAPLFVFTRWGVLCAPWFFMVSGFMNSYTRYVNPLGGTDDFFESMIHRLALWYPMYVFSLTWCALRYFSVSAEDWSHYMSELLLVHGFMWEQTYFPYWCNGWWLSFLAVYLLTWYPMHQVLSDSTNDQLRVLFYMAWGITVPSCMIEWYFMGEWAFFSLFQYWPSFVMGQALATWFVRTCMQQKCFSDAPNSAKTQSTWILRPLHEMPLLLRFGPTISFLVLGVLCFLFSPVDRVPLLHISLKPIFAKGALLPLQGLMIVGLACEVDPVAKLFARKPFCWGDRLTMSMFFLQSPIHNTVRDWTGWDGLTWTFWIILFSASLFGYYAYELPWRHHLKTLYSNRKK